MSDSLNLDTVTPPGPVPLRAMAPAAITSLWESLAYRLAAAAKTLKPLEAPSPTIPLSDDAVLLGKAQRARHTQVHHIPMMRLLGFAVLSLIALLYDLVSPAPFSMRTYAALAAMNMGYAIGSWLILRRFHGRTGRIDLGLLFLHLDILAWLVMLHHVEDGQLFLAIFLLVRVSDQVGFGFRRAIYFSHVVALAYLAYLLYLDHVLGQAAVWQDRSTILVTLYLVGAYISIAGLAVDSLWNRTRSAVQQVRTSLQQLNHQTEQLKAQATELDRARSQAEQANLAKTQFLATISHEIRTPMSGLLGTTELLLDSGLTPGQRHLAVTAHDSAVALLAIINDVLDVSRIESGKLTLECAAFDARALMADVVRLMAAAAHAKGLAIHAVVPPELPPALMGDAARLRQVLLNLVTNAIKFTERGSVTLGAEIVELRGQRLRLRLVVEDTGIGIAAGQLQRIFEPFTQADASTTRVFGGSGLGLSIVTRLVRLMGGEVGVSSEVGKGSVFSVELGFDQAVPGDTAPRAGVIPPAMLDCDVLLAEDNVVNQMVMTTMLRNIGCRVDLANDGVEASEMALAREYDLVLMDCQMPRMDGYQATGRIRAAERERARGRRTPIVALTANAFNEDRTRCLAAGMDDFVAKPASQQVIAAAVAHWSGRGAGQEDRQPLFGGALSRLC